VGGAQWRHASRRVPSHTKPAFHTSRSCVHTAMSQLILCGLAIRYLPETRHMVGPLVFRRLLADATLQITQNAGSSLRGAPNTELREITRLLKRRSRSRMSHDAICYILDRLVSRQQQPHTTNAYRTTTSDLIMFRTSYPTGLEIFYLDLSFMVMFHCSTVLMLTL